MNPLLFDLTQAKIELVSQPVPEEIEGHYGEQDGQAGDGGDPPRVSRSVPSVGHHGNPSELGGGNARTEEAEGGLDQDHNAHLKRSYDDESVDGAREQVDVHNAKRRRPGDAGQ